MELAEKKPAIRFTPGKRCSDYDADCAGVKDHLRCWKGGPRFTPWGEAFVDQADGYCPFLLGEVK